ncbi:hypothetical protein [Nevskia sp.]|uniref:hypothetical protein n=1 Tax=Nevskia sp. TaxID=1929292 RepID=UPI0025F759FC|nr:hypothetical protein [Nevskia sp.]
MRLLDLFPEAASVSYLSVIWFHGTRLLEAHTINSEGLLPAHLMRSRLREYLATLADGQVRRGGFPNAAARAAKHVCEGPFGFLFRDALNVSSGSGKGFVHCPELVEDIANSLLGEGGSELIARFRAATSPYVINFIGESTTGVVPAALSYLFRTMVKGEDSVEAVSIISPCFDGAGEVVGPGRIIRIERLPEEV